MDIAKGPSNSREIRYGANLLGSIRQILTGLQGFDAMARELIQNADDAGATEIRFDICEGSLTVWNDAKFDACGHDIESDICKWELETSSRRRKACDFHAISNVSSSNKYLDRELIGRFGIGFVSVYQVTDTPIIRSRDVQLELDPLRGKSTISTISEIDGSEFILPWAYDPDSPFRSSLSASAITPSDLDVLQNDLVRVAKDCLLFLRNLKKIEISRDEIKIKSSERLDLDGNKILLAHQPEDTVDDWFIIRADANEAAQSLRERYVQIKKLDRQTSIQIAFLLDQETTLPGQIFAYLPTEQQSPLPCHINADFFPEQNRKALILSGEQHERYWNEMLLGVVAKEIANHLLELRNIFNPEGLWHLIGEAFEKRNTPHFGIFWEEISSKALDIDIIWTSQERWTSAESCRIGPIDASEEQEEVLSHIGLDLTHRSIRPYQNALQSIGVKRLTLSSLVSALEEWDEILLDDDFKDEGFVFEQFLPHLWSLINSLLPSSLAEAETGQDIILRLKKIRIAPKADNTLQPIDDLYRLPPPVKNDTVIIFVPDIPLVMEKFGEFDRLLGLVDLLTFTNLLTEVAARIKSEAEAKEFFGSEKKFIRDFYTFLSSFPREESENASSLKSCPCLAGYNRFLPPEKAVLPGGFVDPVGSFDTLDVSYFDDRSRTFLKDVLNVRVLTLKSYIVDHLENIIAIELTEEVYAALVVQIAEHRELLDDDEATSVLESMAFVRTIDGQMRRASDCYFKTKELMDILGDDTSLWVDTSLFSSNQKDLVQIFLNRLGMRTRPSFVHVLDRIDTIVEHDPSERTVTAISSLFHFLFSTYEEEDLSNREAEFEEEIERLRNTDWLPAVVEGELDTSTWYAPHEIYQSFRSSAFESQVPVLAIRMKQRRSFTGSFLNFMEMPALPDTATIVNHLIHCIGQNIEANTTVYQVLTEKLKDEDDLLSLEKLRLSRCVYSSKYKKYVSPGRVFWTDPKLSRFCFHAPDWMYKHKELFDFLGVDETPDSGTYAGVLNDIAESYGGNTSELPQETQLMHGLCLKELANHIRAHPEEGPSLLSVLEAQPFFITVAGTMAFSDEIAIKDNDWLVEPFADELNSQLVHASPEHVEVLDLFGVPRLSAVTDIETVRLGEETADDDAAIIFRERSPLLLRLLSSVRAETRNRIVTAFAQIEIIRTDLIQVRSVFSLTDPPIVSTPQSVRAHFDNDQSKLFLHLDLGDAFWSDALKVMIASLSTGDDDLDIRGIAFIGRQVLQSSSFENAQRDLEEAGYFELTQLGEQPLDIVSEGLGDLADDDTPGFHEQSEEADGSGGMSEDLPPEEKDHQETTAPQIDNTGLPASNIGKSRSSRILDTTEADETEHSTKGAASSINTSDTASYSNPSPSNHDGEENSRTNRRTEWMRSYVVPKTGEENDNDTSDSSSSHERNMAIDESAMRAIIEFETNRQCIVERMPHFNPGYDAVSKHPETGEKRLIEVKGLDGPWTERGVKLSRTQIMNAEEYGEEFWLYVVEHARDDKNRKVYAINNPFFKASEFWFDEAWKQVVDETGGDLKSRFIPGKKVRMKEWGLGTITDVQKRGIATNITIDFHIHGLRNIPLNLSRMELIED